MTNGVAVIGIGTMGAPIATRLQAAGFPLVVCDANETALAAFRASGAATTHKAADCGAADVVLAVVATPAQLHAVLLGESGLRAGVSPAHRPIVVVMSTVPVKTMLDLADGLGELGIRLVDAPVSGGAVGAESGTLTILTGGDATDIESVMPVLTILGDKIFHCGGIGAAQTLKIVNNVMCIASTLITAESYRLAAAQGLDLSEIGNVIDLSTGRNFLTAASAGVPASYARIAPNRESFDTILSILRKDMALAVEMTLSPLDDFPAMQGLKSVLDNLGDETFATWRRVGEATTRSSGSPIRRLR